MSDNPYKVHADARALSGIRILKNGAMRQYTATTFPNDPWQGCEHMIRTGMKLGMLRPPSAEKSVGVLDVLNEDGDIVQDFDIVTARGLRYLKRKLGWRVESEDGTTAVSAPGQEG